MNLFHQNDPAENLLPKDGMVNYHSNLMSSTTADHYFDSLLRNIDWKNDEIVIFGKRVVTKRKVAWYGDDQLEYTYAKITKKALPWTRELIELKELIQQSTGEYFNTCLLNLYHNGSEGMGWHSDDEKELKNDCAIASISLGADRTFNFKHKDTKEMVSILLQNGSLLLMRGETQKNWKHCLPPRKLITQPRINLTFRTILPG
ncbi:MAG: alpha-ketoglutarate-dependent dioxygenase AlkB [Saprospiraceae bacterium]|nr:alpha-ketoglutarate-dependent dioxygenase AlkB [Saprospiraceae bacterium]